MKFGPFNRAYKPCSYTRFQKYTSDGTGRDKYVVSHHGGQYNEEDECSLKLRKFRDTMRDGGWKNHTTREGGWKVVKEARRERAMSEYQRSHNAMLSVPKRTTVKYEDELRKTRQRFHEQ